MTDQAPELLREDLLRAWNMLMVLAISPVSEWRSKAELHQEIQWMRMRGYEHPLTRPPSERPMVPEISFDPTNHHNALKCPYCNPDGLVLATPPAGSSLGKEENSVAKRLRADECSHVAMCLEAATEIERLSSERPFRRCGRR